MFENKCFVRICLWIHSNLDTNWASLESDSVINTESKLVCLAFGTKAFSHLVRYAHSVRNIYTHYMLISFPLHTQSHPSQPISKTAANFESSVLYHAMLYVAKIVYVFVCAERNDVFFIRFVSPSTCCFKPNLFDRNSCFNAAVNDDDHSVPNKHWNRSYTPNTTVYMAFDGITWLQRWLYPSLYIRRHYVLCPRLVFNWIYSCMPLYVSVRIYSFLCV